jgi:hypothetical protein
MKRGDVLAGIADLTGDDPARREFAIGLLEAIPKGFLEDHPLPRKKVAPYIPRLAQLLGSDVPVVIKRWCAQLIGESGIQSPEILDALLGALGNSSAAAPSAWAVAQLQRAAKAVDDMPRIHAQRALEQWAREGFCERPLQG